MFRVVVCAVSIVVLALISLGIIGNSAVEDVVESAQEKLKEEQVVEAIPEPAAHEERTKDQQRDAAVRHDTIQEIKVATGNHYVRSIALLCFLLWTAKHDSMLVVMIILFFIATSINLGNSLSSLHFNVFDLF